MPGVLVLGQEGADDGAEGFKQRLQVVIPHVLAQGAHPGSMNE